MSFNGCYCLDGLNWCDGLRPRQLISSAKFKDVCVLVGDSRGRVPHDMLVSPTKTQLGLRSSIRCSPSRLEHAADPVSFNIRQPWTVHSAVL